ncbi:MAG: pyruvate dehydrogenase (acetyl-transferring), homodimeric type [Planctomycetes bacterium]|nr:pyruvate dehydrogenase (acetyl-transferring), homodimeric type [Planctomycetota bacterium]
MAREPIAVCEPSKTPVDADPLETQEWVDSLLDVLHRWGPERVRYLLAQLAGNAHAAGVQLPVAAFTPQVNSIPPSLEPEYPGDEALETRIEAALRWNAIAMVVRANRKHKGLGGHLATYASVCTAFEVGFNHFFRAPGPEHGGDQVFFQGHASPGIYARAYLEGRFSKERLELFRQELSPGGLSSYPHPWLQPDFWSFPTVSMGLGALQAIYQARFNRYVHQRGLANAAPCRVWNFLGDGEMDEPESVGALSVAAREGLDNLVFVVNCNLQRLDGPVRGNGSVVRELEGLFRGAGWNVLKVLWASEWDALFERDEEGHLVRRLSSILDGDMQRIASLPGAERRKALFNTPELQALTAHLSDDEVEALRRGGHDRKKLYAAYKEAVDGDHPGVPTAILIHTIKGWGMGDAGESKNVAHQSKTLDGADRARFRERFEVQVPADQLEEFPYVDLEADAPARDYLLARRAELGGPFPVREVRAQPLENPPTLEELSEFLGDSGGREVSTTMAFVRMLGKLMRHEAVGELLVPIIPDEARTFGMDALFRPFGIYSPNGQRYEPVDKASFLYYREASDGQILEEGITEAGATSSFIAAGTAYAVHGVNTIPVYVFYSMFGFQRVMDLIWAAGDARAKGFLFGATAGRTTLNGEGLQHEDGHSHLLASCVPTVRAYDPAYGYETAVLVQDGIRRMYQACEPGFYYITLYNENYEQPAMPEGAEEGIVAGMYRLGAPQAGPNDRPQLFGSGPILREVLRAQAILETFGVEADVWSVTSYSQLRLDALAAERVTRLNPDREHAPSYLERCLADLSGPFVAASDYVQQVPALIAPWVPGHLHVLGTDGFGRSDTRAALRRHFEIDAEHIVVTTLGALARRGDLEVEVVLRALEQFEIDREALDPVTL